MRQEGPRLYTLAVRLTGNASDGQDLAAETFVRAFRSFGSFRGEAAFGTCRKLRKNQLRARKRRFFWGHFSIGSSDDSDETPALGPADPAPAPDALAEKDERRRRVEAALGKLEPDDRTILLLRETEDLS